MKLVVQGIEEIELTDPAGLCNPPPRQGFPMSPNLPSGIPPNLPAVNPLPGGFGDPHIPRIPGAGVPGGFGDGAGGAVRLSNIAKPPIYTRGTYDPTKWDVGGKAIQRASQQVGPDRWEKNWQSKTTGEDPGDGNRDTH